LPQFDEKQAEYLGLLLAVAQPPQEQVMSEAFRPFDPVLVSLAKRPARNSLAVFGKPLLHLGIANIGKTANVKADVSPAGKVKFASAYDLRRSFGARWSQRVMPVALQQLMRHEDSDATMRYYVGQNAEATADAVWEAFERQSVDRIANSGPADGERQEAEQPAKPYS
jgi:integrase